MSKFWEILNATDETPELRIYGPIFDDAWFDGEVGATQFAAQLAEIDSDEITVRINSPGGGVFAGLAIYNSLRHHPALIDVRVDGLAASAASLVAMAGDKINMPTGSVMMIHNPSMIALGDAEELRRGAESLDQIRDSLVDVYTTRTGIDSAEVIDLLDNETWMSASRAVELGFADSADGDAVSASIKPGQVMCMAGLDHDLSALESLPEVDPDPDPDPDPEVVDQVELDAEPDLDPMINAAFDDGHVAGVAKERARIRACYDLLAKAGSGHDALAARALFDEPLQPEALAVAIIESEQHQAQVALAKAKRDAPTIGDADDPNTIAAGSLPVGDNTKRAHLNAAMVAGGNATRGGK